MQIPDILYFWLVFASSQLITPQRTQKNARIMRIQPINPPITFSPPPVTTDNIVKITKPIKKIIPISNLITSFYETIFSEKEIFLVFILWPFLSLTFHLLIFFFLFILCLPFVINKSDNAIDDPANQTTNRIHHQIIYVKHTNLCDKL